MNLPRLKKLFSTVVIYSGYYRMVYLLKKITGREEVTILFYHRIIDYNDKQLLNPSLLSSNPRNFEKQMKYLSKNYNVISFDDLIKWKKNKKNLPKKSVIITFDDGYKDNYLNAYPILRKYKLPAMIALTTGHIDNDELFWWDKVAYMINNSKVKNVDVVGFSEILFEDKLNTIRLVEKKVKNMDEDLKNQVIENLRKKLKVKLPKQKNLFLSWKEIKEMSNNNISFCAHTVTHPILTRVSLTQAKKEILNSRINIEKKIKKKINVFTYPNGGKKDMSKDIDDFLKEKDFEYCLSTMYGTNNLKKDMFRLKRVGINKDDDLNLFKIKIMGLGKFASYVYLRFLR